MVRGKEVYEELELNKVIRDKITANIAFGGLTKRGFMTMKVTEEQLATIITKAVVTFIKSKSVAEIGRWVLKLINE